MIFFKKKISVAAGFISVVVSLISAGAIFAMYVGTSPSTISYKPILISTLQQMTSEICEGLDVYDTLVLEDSRDGDGGRQSYRIRKLPDSHCWMIDNLKLAGYELTTADSDVAVNFTIPPLPANLSATPESRQCDSSITVSLGNRYLTCNGQGASSAENNALRSFVDPSEYPACKYRFNISKASTTACGYYYNWYTATAGSGGYELAGTPSAAADAQYSICPINWRLPSAGVGTATSANDFAVLNATMYDNNLGPSIENSKKLSENWWYTGMFSGSPGGTFLQGFSGIDIVLTSSSADSNNSNSFKFRLGQDSSPFLRPGTYNTSKIQGAPVRCMI